MYEVDRRLIVVKRLVLEVLWRVEHNPVHRWDFLHGAVSSVEEIR